MQLWVKIFLGLLLGTVTGLVMGPNAEIFKPLGTLFLNLISMIIIPLVLASIVTAIANISDPVKLRRIGLKTISTYLATTLAAIFIGIIFAKLFKPGESMHLSIPITLSTANAPQLSDLLFSLIPHNPIMAFVDGNVLQVVVFALFLGVAITFSGDNGKPIADFFNSLAEVMSQLTALVMELSPIGVFGIMSWVFGSFGFNVLLPLAKFLTVYYLACLVHIALIFCLMLKFMVNVHPWPFFRGMRDAILMAFSTCSSSATLPVAMDCLERNVGVSRNITSFVMPLGSTMNMNGAAIFQGMSAVFMAQIYGIDLSWQNILFIVITATFSAIGATGVPGAGFVMLSYVLGSAGLPLEGLALFVSIDRIREMISTVLNVLGDAVCAVYIAKVEGEFNENQYYREELLEIEGDEV